MVDHRTDYYRAVNALDLVEWLASNTEDAVTLAHYVERVTKTLARVNARLEEVARGRT